MTEAARHLHVCRMALGYGRLNTAMYIGNVAETVEILSSYAIPLHLPGWR